MYIAWRTHCEFEAYIHVDTPYVFRRNNCKGIFAFLRLRMNGECNIKITFIKIR